MTASYRNWMGSSRRATGLNGLFLACVLIALVPVVAHGQTFTVLHDFTGGEDGESPYSGLTLDGYGNLYGTTAFGGTQINGTVFRIAPQGQDWSFTSLYRFNISDGQGPQANVTIAPNGTLYGTTEFGGPFGQGTVYHMQPAANARGTADNLWTESVLHSFGPIGDGNGILPWLGSLVLDSAGNLYGTTSSGGIGSCSEACGTVFELTPAAGGEWTHTVLYRFTGGADGAISSSGVIRDRAGRLYGTALGSRQYPYGTVYELVPTESGWTESTIYAFQGGNDGDAPVGGLIMDQAGNLYGTSADGGADGGGVVYELTPSGDNWIFTPIYSLHGGPGGGSESSLTMDAAGNLYGTASYDGAYYDGSVFKLTPQSNGQWSYTDLYDFSNGSDGETPMGALAVDAAGNIYGTTVFGGAHGKGVAFKLTQ